MILLNGTNISVGGGIQVTLSLINELSRLDLEEHIVFALPNYMKGRFKESVKYKYEYIEKTGIRNRRRFLNSLVEEFDIDKVFTVFGPSYWRPKRGIYHLVGFALPWIVYEDSPLFNRLTPFKLLRKKIYNKFRLFFFSLEATEIWVETDDVKERLSYKLPNKYIHVVSNSVSDEFINSLDNVKLPARDDMLIYGLFLSHWYEHKNFEILFTTDFEKHPYIRYLVTLTEESFEKIPDKVRDHFINIGVVTPGQCRKLYDYCDFVVQPSFLECFSANLVEAMYCKKIVLASGLSFSYKICKDSALYFDPTSSLEYNSILSKYLVLNSEEKSAMEKDMATRLSTFLNSRDRAKFFFDVLIKDKDRL